MYKTLISLGLRYSVSDCTKMIEKESQKEYLTKDQFVKLMQPKLLAKLEDEDINVEELKAVFIEADIDFTGYLSTKEFH